MKLISKLYNEMFGCDKCDNNFQTKASLDSHKLLHCEHCNQVFVSLLQLKKHKTISGHY